MKRSELTPGKTYQAYSPKGDRIKGTYDKTPGTALVSHYTVDEHGDLDMEWAGDTEMYWDGQYTVKDKKGETVYICEDGNEWSESQLDFREEET